MARGLTAAISSAMSSGASIASGSTVTADSPFPPGPPRAVNEIDFSTRSGRIAGTVKMPPSPPGSPDVRPGPELQAVLGLRYRGRRRYYNRTQFETSFPPTYR